MYFWNPTAFQLECSKMPTASELPAASGRSANLSAWLHEGRRVLPFVIAACRGAWWVIRNLKHCRGNPCDHGTFHPTFTEGPIQTRSNWNPETWKALRPWLGINSSLKNSQFSESFFNSFASWCDLFFFGCQHYLAWRKQALNLPKHCDSLPFWLPPQVPFRSIIVP